MEKNKDDDDEPTKHTRRTVSSKLTSLFGAPNGLRRRFVCGSGTRVRKAMDCDTAAVMRTGTARGLKDVGTGCSGRRQVRGIRAE
jgi:hypothetical protein